MVNFKVLKNSILAQIIVLIGLFFVSMGTLEICHSIIDRRSGYLAGLLDNERSRVEISHILQKKSFPSMFVYMISPMLTVSRSWSVFWRRSVYYANR